VLKSFAKDAKAHVKAIDTMLAASDLSGAAAAVDILLRGVPQRVALKTRRRRRMQQWRKGGGGMRRLQSGKPAVSANAGGKATGMRVQSNCS
jgi:hypothetical protein